MEERAFGPEHRGGQKKRCTAIVLAAGQGKRMGGKVQKQFLELMGKPIVYYALSAFQSSPLIEHIVLVTGKDEISYCREEIVEKYGFTKVHTVAAGGRERYHSVWNGLRVIAEEMPQAEREGIVFIHDGVRPFIDEAMFSRAVRAVEAYGACVIAMPVKETIKIADAEGFVADTPARKRVWGIQTPQVFDFELAYGAYRTALESGRTDMTDDAMIVEAFTDVKVKLVEGSYENIKITTPEDLEIAQAFLKRRELI